MATPSSQKWLLDVVWGHRLSSRTRAAGPRVPHGIFLWKTVGVSVIVFPRTPIRLILTTAFTIERTPNFSLLRRALVETLDDVCVKASPAAREITEYEPPRAPEACQRALDRPRRVCRDDPVCGTRLEDP